MIRINDIYTIFYDNTMNEHRRNGFSYINHKGNTTYHFHGKLHREDGPAAICRRSELYYLNGITYTKEEHEEKRVISYGDNMKVFVYKL